MPVHDLPRRCGHIGFRAALVITATMMLTSIVRGAQPNAPPLERVRPTNSVITSMIERATARSTTFRGLVAAINGTDGIVYVHNGRCGWNVRACLLLSVSVAGPNRILHVRVDPRSAGNELMASIGHELRHAMEVLNDPSVRSYGSIYSFYQRVAPAVNGRFETNAAIQTGLDVLGELRRSEEHP